MCVVEARLLVFEDVLARHVQAVPRDRQAKQSQCGRGRLRAEHTLRPAAEATRVLLPCEFWAHTTSILRATGNTTYSYLLTLLSLSWRLLRGLRAGAGAGASRGRGRGQGCSGRGCSGSGSGCCRCMHAVIRDQCAENGRVEVLRSRTGSIRRYSHGIHSFFTQPLDERRQGQWLDRAGVEEPRSPGVEADFVRSPVDLRQLDPRDGNPEP